MSEDHQNDNARIICACRRVTRQEFLQLVERYQLTTLEQTCLQTGIASSCGFCWEEVEEILGQVVNASP